MAKSTAAEVTRRVNSIYKLLLLGKSRANILQYAAKKKWECSPRSVDTYIKRAKELVKAQATLDQQHEMGLAQARLSLLFDSSFRARDYRTALAVQKELNALANLYPVAELNVTGLNLSPEGMALLRQLGIETSEVVRELEALLKEHMESKS